MKKVLLLIVVTVLIACKSDNKNIETADATLEKQVEETITKEMPVKISPIQHATFVMEWDDKVVYVDPTGGAQSFEGYSKPNLILVTDIHGDHFDIKTLSQLSQSADIVVPQAVFDKMPEELQEKSKILNNGQSMTIHGLEITGVAMYNLTEERLKFHEKGRGNGYVISQNDYRVYISGDTEDVPEMRNLENIDLAFICMNLPYTMTPEAAADATLAFKPNKVMPYHYRGAKDGETFYFDVQEFKSIVNSGNDQIKVELLEWYPTM